MERLALETANRVDKNIEKILELFPNTATEKVGENGELKRAVDFEKLKQELSEVVVDGEESYDFTWVGKKEAMVEANKPIRKTLRPDRNSSVDWENTQNIYIEGDNLEALKLLQESYLGKVKMIYIDPPYNTGNNLIYKNNFYQTEDEYLEEVELVDGLGYKLVLNTKYNGRFHSDWCSMMYARLLIARNLLLNDGFIAIAIDDNELYNLKKITDEVFGEENYIGTIVTRSNPQGRNKNNIDPVHEYHIIYAKNFSDLPLLKIEKKDNGKQYGYLMRSGTNSRKHERPYRFYPMLVKNNKVSTISKEEYENIYAKNKCFDENYLKLLKTKYEEMGYKFILPISKDNEEKVWQRMYDRVVSESYSYVYESGQIKVPLENIRTPISLWSEDIYSNVSCGTNKLKELFKTNKTLFDFPKSIFTVRDLISLNSSKNDIIIDFFPGSATTAHACMQLNAEDGGNRKFIMVQLPETTDEQSEAYKAGYKNICEIGKERIRRAGKKIKEENPDKNIDVGFRVFKVDDTNMKDIYYSPKNYNQNLLDQLESNIKEDRTDEDLLYGVLLDWGVELSLPHRVETVEDKKVHIVNDDDLIACFEDEVPEGVVRYIANLKPTRAVFKDSSFKTDDHKINVEEIFKLISPDTTVKVI